MPKDDTPEPIEHRPPDTDAAPKADPGAGWRVILDSDGFAVKSAAGERVAVFSDKATACLAASILPQTRAGLTYRLSARDDPNRPGFDVTSSASNVEGWMREYDPESVEGLHLTTGIARSASSLAFFLEAVDTEVLSRALRTASQRRGP